MSLLHSDLFLNFQLEYNFFHVVVKFAHDKQILIISSTVRNLIIVNIQG